MTGQTLWLVITEDTGVDRTPWEAEHRAYMADLVSRGVVFASGPTSADIGEEPLGGATVLRMGRLSDVRRVMDAEPYVKSGARSYSVTAWSIRHGDVVTR